jgi:tetratricopeptide (TPR) repeat protein
LKEQAHLRYEEGLSALSRGEHKQALKSLSVSISMNPTIEAYVERAEANFCSGNIEAALDDLERAEALTGPSGWAQDLESRVEQARNRYIAAQETDIDAPPPEERLSFMLPTTLPALAEVMAALSELPDVFSTDGATIIRSDGTVIYDMELLGKKEDWAQVILQLTVEDQLSPEQLQLIDRHLQFIHISAPNLDYAQSTKSQPDLAIEALTTVRLLAQQLNSPAILFRNSNRVHTQADLEELVDNMSAETLLSAYVKLLHDLDSHQVFSTGMHALGYADAQVSDTLVDSEVAPDLIVEFLMFELINNVWQGDATIDFQSAVTGKEYLVELVECERFTEPGEARFNPNGVWTFVSLSTDD